MSDNAIDYVRELATDFHKRAEKHLTQGHDRLGVAMAKVAFDCEKAAEILASSNW